MAVQPGDAMPLRYARPGIPISSQLDISLASALIAVTSGPILRPPFPSARALLLRGGTARHNKTPGSCAAPGVLSLWRNENDEGGWLFSVLLGFAFGEDDLVDEEEDDHRDAAVEHGGADVVDEVGHQQTGHRDPDAVDGVDDAGDDADVIY